ncbi:amidohydrolase [Corynebacterium sp. TAE3-ERU12]|uniref:amidohydrolase n=1 Tax=Corynebacterium sp. TAE3-ERU12 TaxID=2849491 RepID=UPI001C466051|nr:amidohydrolase [Corynebacterium sp. TAE3-ERU12]MBV7294767.1 amidohydrolase [Corynebacterium sp. TAE3-ERU12]
MVGSVIEDFIRDWWQRNSEQLLEWRRHLHAHPELSHMEYNTTDFIVEKLTDAGLEPVRFPNTGAMVDVGDERTDVDGVPMGRLAFRGDMDALPMTEATGLEFSSRNDGVMHACGHDFHTIITLGTALAMAEYDRVHGVPVPLRFIFQPAEEVMQGGAPDVIEAGALKGVSRIFALHVEPKLRVGHVGVRVGAITSAGDTMTVTVEGPGGHTARPHLTADVTYALAKLITDLPALLSRRVDPRSGTVVAVGAVNAGYAANAIPTHGSLMSTIRTGDIATWRSAEPLIRSLIADILAPTGVSHSIDYTKGVPPVLNDDYCTALIAETVRRVDPQAVIEAPQSSGGEDFGWYLESVPGAMARLGCWPGVGDKQDLHRDDLVVDERCLGVGVRLFCGVVARLGEDEGDRFVASRSER